VVVLLVLPGDRARALDVYVLFLGAVVLLSLARLTAGTREPAHRQPRTEEPASGRLPEVARIEREVVLATGSGFDQHVRINPLLRDITRHRLWTRRGVDIDERPDRARELLGPELWELVQAGPPDPNSRYLRGLDLTGLHRAVDKIEGL